jgi:hypothetical protein
MFYVDRELRKVLSDNPVKTEKSHEMVALRWDVPLSKGKRAM